MGGTLQGSRRATAGRPGRAAGLARLLLLAVGLALCQRPGLGAAQQGVRVLGTDSLRVVYWEAQRVLAERALRTATGRLVLPGLPEDAVRVTGTIVLAPSEAVYDSVVGGRAPRWSAGVAIPSRRLIVLPSFVSSRTPTGDPIVALRHELAHLALSAYLPDNVPRWFNEGYATWASGEWDENSGWQIRMAFLTGAAPPLDSLRLGWPGGETDARLAYLLSASAVRHLATRGGPDAFAALLAAWRREGTLDAAIRSTYQMTLTQFEREWRTLVRRRYGWLLALAQMGAFWLVLGGILVFFGAIRRRRDRARLAELEAAPEPKGEVWWIETPGGRGGVDGQSRVE